MEENYLFQFLLVLTPSQSKHFVIEPMIQLAFEDYI